MKKNLFMFWLLPLFALGQTPTENYTKLLTYRDSTQTSDATKAITQVIYNDGLGRPKQKISGKMSASGTDLITFISYDSLGRQSRNYLPYASTSTNQAFDASALTNTLLFYNDSIFENTQNPYSEMFYEASPLNRIKKQSAPGTPWLGNTANDNDHTKKFAYSSNAANEVLKLSATASWNGTNMIFDVNFVSDGYYSTGQLYKTITKNENIVGSVYTGNVLSLKINNAEEFKDKDGKILLKRTYTSTPTEDKNVFIYTTFDTYYVYDQFGNLTFVIPPLANGALVDELCYQYKYDDRNRIIEKKIPGKQWEFIVYDKMDRIVASGPVFTPFGGSETGWIINRYDAFGRNAYSGYISTSPINSAARKLKQEEVVSIVTQTTSTTTVDGIGVNYNTFPVGLRILLVNYYDNYLYPNAPTSFSAIEGQAILNGSNNNLKGLATGSLTRVLSTTPSVESSYILYDTKGRAVSSFNYNYLGGYTQIDKKLDFDSTVLYSITKFKRSISNADALLTTREDFTYTLQDRLLGSSHKIGNQAQQLINYNTYNSIGQLTNKKVGGTDITGAAYLQSIDYTYNIRGWLKGINDVDSPLSNDLFAFKINYNSVGENINGAIVPLYNGNIAEIYWKTANDNITRKYGYSYDKLNRLTDAYYQKPNEAVPVTNSYNEFIKYDNNGNINSLIRNGQNDNATLNVEIDNLAYTYGAGTNKLLKVVDNTNNLNGFKDSTTNTQDDYGYDDNGNLSKDNNKGITSITYNHLNLPTQIVFNNSTSTKITYLYNASGVKLKKTVTNSTDVVTDYLNGYQYKNGILTMFPTSEGHVKANFSNNVYSYNYIYNYKDHLGNVRLSYAMVGRQLAILEESNYYPFGLKHTGYNIALYEPTPSGLVGVLQPYNNYKYNGKELQDELGLNMYDYGARNYDPSLGKWMNIDPLAETSRRFSPYAYAFNNPVYFVDPDGMSGVGADGLTNEQWWATTSSGLGTNDDSAKFYKEANRQTELVESQLDKEVNKEYGKEGADKTRIYPLSTAVIMNMINKLPTLKKILKAAGKVNIKFIDIDHGPAGFAQAATTDTRERDSKTDEIIGDYVEGATPYMHFYRIAFETYRGLAFTILHEFGHLKSLQTGFFQKNLKSFGESAYPIDEVYAFQWSSRNGGRNPSTTSSNSDREYFKTQVDEVWNLIKYNIIDINELQYNIIQTQKTW